MECGQGRRFERLDFSSDGARYRRMISHRHHCIFTHVPKTAGKSVRSLFGLPEFESDFVAGDTGLERAFGHRPLLESANEVYFADYFKFSFVRNPFDRIVSAYYYLENGGCNAGDKQFRDEYLAVYDGRFAAFVEDLPRLITSLHFRPQIDWLCDGKQNILADFVGRFESLERDVATIADRFGLSYAALPVINASRHRPYRQCYDDSSRRRIAQIYGEDIEAFAYQFE
jgi:chondroitin 4-sulfotransferase 11